MWTPPLRSVPESRQRWHEDAAHVAGGVHPITAADAAPQLSARAVGRREPEHTLGALGHISPFFIVSDIPRAIRFYEQLGFEPRVVAPEQEPFFAIVGRDSVQVYLKNVSDESHTIEPQPNHTRHKWAAWDAFVFVADPDVLAEEFASRGVKFEQEIHDRDDGVRGFAIRDNDGYVLFFGRPS